MSEKNVLLIFVKNPEKGKVKTRLAETIGDDKALEVYKKLTDYTHKISVETSVDRQVWYSNHISDNDTWDAENFAKRLQKGDDLGQRMQAAFSEAFNSGYSKAVIIGSDCAELTSSGITDAFSRLDNHDIVVGPSKDGGYYLLGMHDFYPELFEGINWSTSEVFPKTLQIARQLGLETTILPELNDVDYEEDWKSVKDQLQ